MRGQELAFRRATEADLDRILEIHLVAYPDIRTAAARQRHFTQNAFGDLDDVVVVERDGEIVAQAFLYRFHAAFGGAWVRLGGIGSVAVAPEARGSGVATALMHRLHQLSAKRGDAVTMLYAFRHGFYGRLGYATTTSRKRLAIDPRSIPSSWRDLARARVGRLRKGDDAALRRLHERAAEQASGWIRRPKRLWEMLLLRERRTTLVCRRGSQPTGYVGFTLVQEESYGPTTLEVDELVAIDPESRRALLGALGAMRDQATEIVLEVADGDPLERVLLDCDGRRSGDDAVEHSLGEVVGGPMVRIHDAARAVTARGYSTRGSFALTVRSDEPGSQADHFRVRVDDGRAAIAPGRTSEGALVTTPAGLAAVLYGGLRVADAVALGLADAPPAVVSRIDAIVSPAPLTPIDAF